mgnify:CR=1 FL=1
MSEPLHPYATVRRDGMTHLICGICGTDLHEYAYGPIFVPKNAEGKTAQ